MPQGSNAVRPTNGLYLYLSQIWTPQNTLSSIFRKILVHTEHV